MGPYFAWLAHINIYLVEYNILSCPPHTVCSATNVGKTNTPKRINNTLEYMYKIIIPPSTTLDFNSGDIYCATWQIHLSHNLIVKPPEMKTPR